MKKTLSFLLALSLALLLLCACTQVTEMDTLDGQTPDELFSVGFDKLDNDQNYVLDITSLTTVSADGTRFETDQSLNTRMVLLKNGDFSVSGSKLWENITINVSASLVGSTLFLKMDQGNNTAKVKTDVSSASDETEEMSEIVNTFVEGFTKFQIEKEWLRNKKIIKDGDNYTVCLTFSEEELTAYNSEILSLLGTSYAERNCTLLSAEYTFTFNRAKQFVRMTASAKVETGTSYYKNMDVTIAFSYPDPMPAVSAPADADDYTDIGLEYDFDEDEN